MATNVQLHASLDGRGLPVPHIPPLVHSFEMKDLLPPALPLLSPCLESAVNRANVQGIGAIHCILYYTGVYGSDYSLCCSLVLLSLPAIPRLVLSFLLSKYCKHYRNPQVPKLPLRGTLQ